MLLIGTRIQEYRKMAGLNQEEFAEKIGLSLNGVSNIERCRYQPAAETIDKIRSAIELSTESNPSSTLLENCPKELST